jgi:sporulation protein YlmC with PRC-barrel domain
MQPRRFKRNLIAALIAPAFVVPGAVLGQQAAQPQQPRQVQAGQETALPIQLGEHDKRASRLIGMDVRNAQDENLGEVRDLVINAQNGNVEYVALAHGGFLGLGQDLYAYPLERFQAGSDRNRLTLDVTREQLQQSQGFDNNDWPKVRADRGFWDRITANFGTNRDQPAATGATAPQQQGQQQAAAEEAQYVRASEIRGEQLRDRQGGNLGQIEDLIVSMDTGEVRHVIVDTEGDDRLVAVSVEDVQVRRDNGDHRVEFTRDKLDLSKSFTQAEWRQHDRDRPAATGR